MNHEGRCLATLAGGPFGGSPAAQLTAIADIRRRHLSAGDCPKGRLLLGVLADRHGAKLVLIGGLLLQALAIGAFLAARSLGEFYAVAAVFGLAYGGVMPLYGALARDYFGPRIMGTVFGAATMVSCVGMAIGPAVGGRIFDRFGSYAGMHLGSLAIGLGAVAIAFTFPPLPSIRPERLRAV